MKNILLTILFLVSFISYGICEMRINRPYPTITEQDGSPIVRYPKIIVPNGSLIDGTSQAWLFYKSTNDASGSTNILNQDTLQTGSTFYVSSGTIGDLQIWGSTIASAGDNGITLYPNGGDSDHNRDDDYFRFYHSDVFSAEWAAMEVSGDSSIFLMHGNKSEGEKTMRLSLIDSGDTTKNLTLVTDGDNAIGLGALNGILSYGYDFWLGCATNNQIRFLPNVDLTNNVTLASDHSNVTLNFTGADPFITADGGDIDFDDENLKTVGAVRFGSMTAYGTITSSTGFIGGSSTFTRLNTDYIDIGNTRVSRFGSWDFGYGLGTTFNYQTHSNQVMSMGAIGVAAPTIYYAGNNVGGWSNPLVNYMTWGAGGIGAGTNYFRYQVTYENQVSFLTDTPRYLFSMAGATGNWLELKLAEDNDILFKSGGGTTNLYLDADGDEIHISTANLYVDHEVWVGSMSAITGTITSTNGFVGGVSTFTQVYVKESFHAVSSTHTNHTLSQEIVIPLDRYVWQTVTGGGENGIGALWSSNGHANGFTMTGDTMCVTGAGGHYIGSFSISYYGKLGNDYEVKIENLTDSTTIFHQDMNSGTGDNNIISYSSPFHYTDAEIDDCFILRIRNMSANNPLNLTSGIFNIWYVSNE